MLKEKIKEILNDYNGLLKPRFGERDGKSYIEFFENDTDWQIELDFEIANGILQSGGEIDKDYLLDCAITRLLKTHDIQINNNTPSRLFVDFDVRYDYAHLLKIKEITAQTSREVVFVNGEPKCGKTFLLKQVCTRLQKDGIQIFWLDFNGNRTNFIELLKNLVKNQYRDIRIILDNLECCNNDNSKNILRLFKSLIRKIRNSHYYYAQLIVVQDSDKKIERLHDGNCKDIDVTYADMRDTFLTQLMRERGQFESNAQLSESEFFYNKAKITTELGKLSNNPEAKRLLFQVALFAHYGLTTRVMYNGLAAKTLIDNVSGVKLAYDSKLSYYPEFISGKILDIFKQNWLDDSIGFAKVFNGRSFAEVSAEMLETFYHNNINISNLEKFLSSTVFAFNSITSETNTTESKNIADFYELLALAKKYLDNIKNRIIDGEMFGNHLGAILFAAEALAIYADDDWAAMQAWKTIAEYVRSEYYIDGQKHLPEIWHNKEIFEKTISDFTNGKNKNSIENQIKLQNDILCKIYGNSYFDVESPSDIAIKSNADFRESDYSYYLSDIQRIGGKDINISKFFGTYILALLFEFEVTAPKEQRDSARIKKLWAMIKSNIIDKKITVGTTEKRLSYFYPARIPWVTARMLLALRIAENNGCTADLYDSTFNLGDLQQQMTNYLEECSIKVEIDGEECRLWTPGTGKWNSVLETTIMTTIAISECQVDNPISAKGLNFINKCKTAGFNSECVADGIWAFETEINKSMLPQYALERVSELRSDLDALFKSGEQDDTKNDRSLGDTHIAKTLISIVKKFVDRKPDILGQERKNAVIELNNKIKVFISFKTDNGALVAQSVYNKLIEGGKNSPFLAYNYMYNMATGNWPNQLTNAVRQANKCILIITTDSLLSEPVLNEIAMMIDFKKHDNVIPVVYKCITSDELDKLKKYITANQNSVFTDRHLGALKEILDYSKCNIVDFDEANPISCLQKIIGYLQNNAPFTGD